MFYSFKHPFVINETCKQKKYIFFIFDVKYKYLEKNCWCITFNRIRNLLEFFTVIHSFYRKFTCRNSERYISLNITN